MRNKILWFGIVFSLLLIILTAPSNIKTMKLGGISGLYSNIIMIILILVAVYRISKSNKIKHPAGFIPVNE